MAEHLICNQEVRGSTPLPGSIPKIVDKLLHMWDTLTMEDRKMRLTVTAITLTLTLVASLASPGQSLMDHAKQDALDHLTNMGYQDLEDISTDGIQVLEFNKRIPCNNKAALGCFLVYKVELPDGQTREYGVMAVVSRRAVKSYTELRKVMAHEWTHALLWLSGDDTWDQHDNRFKK